jgi:hypothetical protein
MVARDENVRFFADDLVFDNVATIARFGLHFGLATVSAVDSDKFHGVFSVGFDFSV